MTVPAGYTEKISLSSERRISTLSGDIRLEQNRGRLAVYQSNTGVARTVVDVLGLTTSDPDGTQRLRAGITRSDGRTIIYASEPGVDIRTKGI